MSLSLKNAFSTLKNSLRAVKSAKQWKSSFHSGNCSTDEAGWTISSKYRCLTYAVLVSLQWWACPDNDGDSKWKPVGKILQQGAEILHQAFPAK